MFKITNYLKEYKKESILAPCFKMLEASFELFVPLVMAAIVDTGIKNADNTYILRMGAILILLGVIGLTCSITAQYFAAKASVEFGKGVLEKLIYAFCDSSYIYQENYVDTLSRLQDIFYLYKNESMDELTDDELIEYMRKTFDETCHGSLDYLEETCLEEFARNIRRSTHKFIGRYMAENEQG